MKKLATFGALISLSFMTSATAHAGSYYNCSNPTGCKPVNIKESTSDYTKTKYPVVLEHGLNGWARLFGFIDYFHGIPQALSKDGADVFVTHVSSVHNSEVRGEQLLKQVKTIKAITGKDKVNLIGHSQGGIDIRYVAGVAPDSVASVTAVSSPEQGSKTADWALKHIAGGTARDGILKDDLNLASKIIMSYMKISGLFSDIGSGIPLDKLQKQDGWEAANGLTEGYMKTFNAKFPQAMPSKYCGNPTEEKVNGIPYYSFSGAGQKTHGLDPSDALLSVTSLTFGDDPNDGLVSSCSSRLGKVLRDDYHMNHADSINHVLGLVDKNETNPIAVYRAQVNRLKVSDGL